MVTEGDDWLWERRFNKSLKDEEEDSKPFLRAAHLLKAP